MFDIVDKHKRAVQIVLALVTLPFAFFGVDYYFRNGDTMPEVARVGDSRVTQTDFDEALREQQERLRQQLGAGYDPAMLQSPEIRYGILEQLINRRLLQEKARSDSLRVSDAQLQEVIGAMPAFQENGQFSPEKYRQLLGTQNMTPVQFENRMRQELLLGPISDPIALGSIVARASEERYLSLLEQQREVAVANLAAEAFAGEVKVDDAAVKAFFDSNAQAFKTPEQGKFEYVVLTPEAVQSQVSVDEAEARAQYQSNLKQFGQEEQRSASHILLSVKPDAKPEEKEAVRKKAEEIAGQAKANPSRFAELAKQYSQDPGSAPQGGDLGTFGRGNMVKAFDDAVFAMKQDEIAGPVSTEFGYHIIKLTGITPAKVKPFEEVRAQIESDLKRQKASSKFAAAADQFQNLVYEQADSLQGVAKALNLTVQTSPVVTRPQAQAIALGNAKFVDVLFSPESVQGKRNTDAIEVAPGTLMAGRIIEYKPSMPLPFEQVKDTIRQQLLRRAQGEAAQKAGNEKLAQLAQGKSERDVGLTFAAPARVERNRPAPGITPDAMRRVFQADSTKLPQYVGAANDRGGFAIYKVTQVITPPVADEQKLKAVGSHIGEQLARELFSAYLVSLKGKSEVKINQANLEKRQ
ncbi:MAG: SurA N-terminal domain-containing protein [Pseudomonadota bacterium]|nr:SurA N-terminal domain-containing protein [Pseudomonadota bacterium]